MNNLRRKTLAAASAVTLGAGLALIGVPAPVAAAGPETSYLVLAPQGNGTAKAAARVAAADGTVVAAYDKIGVLVARSSAPDFATRVAGAGVESVASTAGLGTALDEGETVEVPAADVVARGDPTAEPLYGQQWDMDMIRVPQAHAVTGGSPSVVVGVLDSGISSSHPDLATQIAKDKSTSCIGGVTNTAEPAWNPTTSDHGTHVAGTIAAAVNGVGVTGVAPGVKVAAVKVVNDDGYIFPEAAVCGFMWAAEHGFQLTNNSYYIDPWQLNCRNDARQRPVWQAVQRALRYSQSQGVLHVASAGNANFDLAHKITDTGSPNNGTPEERENLTNACLVLPAEAPGVVTVAAVGPTGDKSYYSSYGQGVIDVTAPGGDTRFRTRGATLDVHRRHPVHHLQHRHPHQRVGLQAGHLDVRPARRRRRGAGAVRAPGHDAGSALLVPGAHGGGEVLPGGRVQPGAADPGGPERLRRDLLRREAQRVLRRRCRRRVQRGEVDGDPRGPGPARLPGPVCLSWSGPG